MSAVADMEASSYLLEPHLEALSAEIRQLNTVICKLCEERESATEEDDRQELQERIMGSYAEMEELLQQKTELQGKLVGGASLLLRTLFPPSNLLH